MLTISDTVTTDDPLFAVRRQLQEVMDGRFYIIHDARITRSAPPEEHTRYAPYTFTVTIEKEAS